MRALAVLLILLSVGHIAWMTYGAIRILDVRATTTITEPRPIASARPDGSRRRSRMESRLVTIQDSIRTPTLGYSASALVIFGALLIAKRNAALLLPVIWCGACFGFGLLATQELDWASVELEIRLLVFTSSSVMGLITCSYLLRPAGPVKKEQGKAAPAETPMTGAAKPEASESDEQRPPSENSEDESHVADDDPPSTEAVTDPSSDSARDSAPRGDADALTDTNNPEDESSDSPSDSVKRDETK